MNHISQQINQILFPPSLKVMTSDQYEDPITKFLSSLYSYRAIEVNLKSKDDVFIEDFLYKRAFGRKAPSVKINIDEDLKLFSKPEKIPTFLGNDRQADFPTGQQKIILSKLKKIPIYTVVNGYEEIVIASPRLIQPKNSLEWLYDKYYENFLWKEDKGPISLGLFFVNREDAATYLQEVCKKDPRGAAGSGLKVKTVGLDFFYSLNRTSKPKMQARLIADLKEIDLLLNEYPSSNILRFHPKQKHTKEWFQGNPIYIMRISESGTEELLEETYMSKYSFARCSFNIADYSNRKLVLFSKADAYKLWYLYKLRHPELSLPEKPSLQIYNLENYLLDLEKNNVSLAKKTTFFVPYDTYMDNSVKHWMRPGPSTVEGSHTKNIKYIPSESRFEQYKKGIIWLFTSDTLPTEDKSW